MYAFVPISDTAILGMTVGEWRLGLLPILAYWVSPGELQAQDRP